jgi:hypothetical protein
MPYFRRAEHAALLVGVALVTYGVGGLVYWLVRRDAWVCPGCGRRQTGDGLSSTQGAVGWERGPPPDPSLPAGGFFRRALGALLAVVGISLLVLAASEPSGAALAIAVGLGLAGILLFHWGGRAQERRRESVLVLLQSRALLLARARSGRLTATDAAAELRITLPAAERLLFSMDDGFRVRSDVTREGVLVFDFPELRLGLLEASNPGLGRSSDLG